jgi:hypothetical protein
MSAATLGYPTKTDAVLALREEGIAPSIIAQRLGIQVKSVSALICSARRRRQPGEAKASPQPTGLIVPLATRHDLRPHAARRNMSTDRLILELLDRVATDGLVDAILDDRDGGHA